MKKRTEKQEARAAFMLVLAEVERVDKVAAAYLRRLLYSYDRKTDRAREADFAPSGALQGSFIFSKTPQGLHFWWGVIQRLRG